MSKPANHKRIQRYKPLESGQQLGENKDNEFTSSCQVVHKFGMTFSVLCHLEEEIRKLC